MFIDEAIIRVKAGNGGNGRMAFRREACGASLRWTAEGGCPYVNHVY
jgi:GTPase involved in cell partitioning and DNA repair